MAKCTICDKGTMAGRRVRHKHSGLWERKAPATVRQFKANVQRRTVMHDGKEEQIKLCTKCLKRMKNYPGWKGYRVPRYKIVAEKSSSVSSVKDVGNEPLTA